MAANPFEQGTEVYKFFDSLNAAGQQALLDNKYAVMTLPMTLPLKGGLEAALKDPKSFIFAAPSKQQSQGSYEAYIQQHPTWGTENFGDFLKSAAPLALAVAMPSVGAALGGALGIGTAAGTALAGAGLGALQGQDLSQIATNAAIGGIAGQLGSGVAGATGSQALGQLAGNTGAGLLSGNDLSTSLTNAAINTGASQAAGGLLSSSQPAPEPYVPPTTDYAPTDYSLSGDVGGLGLQATPSPLDTTNPYSFDNNYTATGGLGLQSTLAPLDATNPYTLAPTPSNNESMGGGQGLLGSTTNAEGVPTTLGSVGADASVNTATSTTNPAAQSLLASLIKSVFTGSSSSGTGNMATTQDNTNALGSLLGSLLGGAGSLMQGSTNKAARQTAANDLIAAGNKAATSSQFRPVGTTTTFGTSNFQIDPATGQLTSAGYTLSPEMQAYQDSLMSGNRQALTDATNISNLGRQYIGQDPNTVASDWYNKQQALLAPSRDVESARLANQLQQTGRTGVSVAQGGNLGAANPEQQALLNARAMADANLAADAQTYGQNQVKFGQGLLTSAYDPFTAGLTAATNVEKLGQQPLGLSTDIAKLFQSSNEAGAKYNLDASKEATKTMFPANQYNPYAYILSGLAGNTQATTAAGNLFGNSATGTALAKYLSGLTGTDLNTAASNYIFQNPDITPQSTFNGGGADGIDPELKALLGL